MTSDTLTSSSNLFSASNRQRTRDGLTQRNAANMPSTKVNEPDVHARQTTCHSSPAFPGAKHLIPARQLPRPRQIFGENVTGTCKTPHGLNPSHHAASKFLIMSNPNLSVDYSTPVYLIPVLELLTPGRRGGICFDSNVSIYKFPSTNDHPHAFISFSKSLSEAHLSPLLALWPQDNSPFSFPETM